MAKKTPPFQRPSREEAEDAIKTILRWIGEDPTREGLLETPARVIKSYEDFFEGYGQDPQTILQKTFNEVGEYDGIVLLRDIRFESHCEHHMVPIIGHVHVAYLPDKHVVGISKLARVVNAFARRLQIQERLTAEIAQAIEKALKPKGVGVFVESDHHCMTTRGVHRPGVSMTTSTLLGCFKKDQDMRRELLNMIHAPRTHFRT